MQRTFFTKMYSFVLAAFLLIMIGFGALVYQNTTRLMIKQLASKCLGIATSVSILIETDIESFRDYAESLDTDSVYYEQMAGRLRKIFEENRDSIAYVYVEKKISDTDMMYLMDGEAEEADTFSPPGYTAALTEVEAEAYRTGKPAYGDWFIEDEFGSLLTAYAPINDSETGELLGLVGTDVSKDQFNSIIWNQFVIILASVVGCMLLLGISMLVSSGWLERAVYRDGLTGIFNKTYFLRSLRNQMTYAARKAAPICVFMADIDHFKKVNDTYGHVFGDVVLKTVSQCIGSTLRKMDCLARYGGEEFAAFLPETSLESAYLAAERVRKAVSYVEIWNEELQKNISVTISIGVAMVKSGCTAIDAVDMADKALYRAKVNRNEVAVYEDKETAALV